MHADVSRRVDCDAMVAADDRHLRPPRRALQQRGDPDVGAARRDDRSDVGRHDRDEPHRDLLGVPRRDPAHARAAAAARSSTRRRRSASRARRATRRTARRRPASSRSPARSRSSTGRDPRQRDRAGIDRHAALPQGDRTPRRPRRVPRACSQRTIPLRRLGLGRRRRASSRCSSRATRRRTRPARSSRATAAWRRIDERRPMTATTRPVVVVTGGASGLGEAIVSRLVVRRRPRASSPTSTSRARSRSPTTSPPRAAVRRDDRRRHERRRSRGVLRRGRRAPRRLDALVCSAAVETRSSVVDCTDDEWQRVLDVNLKGPFLCMKHGIPRSRAAAAARSCSSARCSARSARPAMPRTARRRARSTTSPSRPRSSTRPKACA